MQNISCQDNEGKVKQTQWHSFFDANSGKIKSKSTSSFWASSQSWNSRTFYLTKGRYQDMLQEFSQSIKAEKKQILRSYYMTTPLRTNQRPHSSKNAEVQVTNIEFISNNSPSKTSKGRRKEAKNRAHFNYTYQGRKLVKHNSVFQDDSFIEPWWFFYLILCWISFFYFWYLIVRTFNSSIDHFPFILAIFSVSSGATLKRSPTRP